MSNPATIRTAAPADAAWVHRLNWENRAETSPVDETTMAAYLRRATLARVVDPDAAFLLAYDQDGSYDSPNFQWFRQRYARFLYVDRVVVSANHRRRGLGQLLYDDLFRVAQETGCPMVTAEINSDPPNPGSDAFHAARGFRTVGEAVLSDRAKTVRYIARNMTPDN